MMKKSNDVERYRGRRRRGAIVIASAWLASAACGDEPRDRLTEVVVDTVAGVVTVSNTGPGLWRSEAGWSVSGRVTRIGSVEGEGPTVFTRIGAVAVAGDRTIFVGDSRAREVRVFSSEGRFLRAFGRGGEGPGEFESIDGLVVEGSGLLAVRDPRLGRVSRFRPDGTFESSFKLTRSFLIFSDGTTFWRDRHGRLYDRINLATSVNEPERLAIIRYSSDGIVDDTVALLQYRSSRILATRGGQPVMAMSAPFAPLPLVAVDLGGRVATGLGAEYRITVLGDQQDTLHIFRRVVEAPPLSEAELDSAESEIRRRMEELAPGARIRDMDLPRRRPLTKRLHADDSGHWWVGRYRGEGNDEDLSAQFPTEYDIFDGEGRFLGTVETPPILIMQIGEDFVAGVETDNLGIQYAVVYALSR